MLACGRDHLLDQRTKIQPLSTHRILQDAGNHVKNGCEGKVVHVFVVRSKLLNCLFFVVVVLLQSGTVALQSFNVKIEESIVAQDDGKAAGELCDAEGVDGNVLVVHDQHNENKRSDEDVERVHDDFEFDKTKHLADKHRRLGCQLQNTREDHCVAAKSVRALVDFVDRR